MASFDGEKISGLPITGALDGTETLPELQDGETRQLSLEALLAYINAEGQQDIISDTADVDLKIATANTLTVPSFAGIVTGIIIIPTTITALTVNPVVKAGIVGDGVYIITDTEAIMPPTELVGFGQYKAWINQTVVGTIPVVALTTGLTLTVTTGAIATTCTARILVLGREL